MKSGLKIAALLFIAVIFLLGGCRERDRLATQIIPEKAKPVGKRVYGPIDPVVLTLPEDVKAALGGVNIDGKPLDKAYVYFRNLNLVVYRESFDVKSYIDSIAEAFKAMSGDEAFSKDIDVWAIQMQKKGGANFVNIAILPKQIRTYASSGNISDFLDNADYVMISDRIVPKEDRLDYYDGDIIIEGPEEFTPTP